MAGLKILSRILPLYLKKKNLKVIKGLKWSWTLIISNLNTKRDAIPKIILANLISTGNLNISTVKLNEVDKIPIKNKQDLYKAGLLTL